MNKTWFRKLLLSYLPVFFIVITILFALFFMTLNEQNRREAVKANEYLAEQVVLTLDRSLKAIDYEVVQGVLTDKRISQFFKQQQVNVVNNIDTIKALDELKFNHPMIDSVYLYRFSDGFVFGDASNTLNEFPDKAFIEQFEAQMPEETWTSQREFQPFEDTSPRRVITLVRGVRNGSQGVSGYYIVNVSANKLSGEIKQLYNPDTSSIEIIDRLGNNLLQDEDKSPQQTAVLSTFNSPYTGYEIRSGVQDVNGLSLILGLYKVWVVVALVVVLLGVLWVIYVTKRNYRPVNQLVSWIQMSSAKLDGVATNFDKEGEFTFIQHTLEHLMTESKQYREQYHEKLVMHKKYYFYQIFEEHALVSEEEWQLELANYNLSAAGKLSQALIIELDNQEGGEEPSDEENPQLRIQMSEYLHGLLAKHHIEAWSEWISNRRIALLLWLPEGVKSSDNLLNEVVPEIQQWIEEHAESRITMGLGETGDTLEQLASSYDTAKQCLQYKAVLGKNRLIRIQDIIKPADPGQEYFKTIYKLSQSIRLAESDWQDHLDRLMDQMERAVLPRREIENLMQFFLHHLEGELLELSKDYRIIWKNAKDQLEQLGRKWDDLHELKKGCQSIFEAMIQKMQVKKDSHSNKSLMIEVRTYIEENFPNAELSLDFLSARFQMNAKYLSKMFKDEFGENFVDFLIGLRMNEAKRLLTETDKSMQAISQEVGYYNYNSFNRAFKNVVGISPRDFRKQPTLPIKIT
ncbi:helix-turn-helix domain-containing protein [Paenibacillus sp. Marseille-Q4541]|uniref:helix-turn-helix domain-containing protein n=1 Tax=Paenibacillus sp. Marseille-Q4541 TaxID=2831522 RepID=UPI001BA7D87A|nr:helix-turn-helix domain-containing protein [Paenibacillus sp. Marseille-Q4541]